MKSSVSREGFLSAISRFGLGSILQGAVLLSGMFPPRAVADINPDQWAVIAASVERQVLDAMHANQKEEYGPEDGV